MTARENAETADLVRDRDEWQRVAAQRGEELERSEREVERLRGELERSQADAALAHAAALEQHGSCFAQINSLKEQLAASQGTRESLVAVLKLANDNTARELAKVQSLTEQLAEATGLLERMYHYQNRLPTDEVLRLRAFLSRAPAQAAEPACKHVFAGFPVCDVCGKSERTLSAESKLAAVRAAIAETEHRIDRRVSKDWRVAEAETAIEAVAGAAWVPHRDRGGEEGAGCDGSTGSSIPRRPAG